MNPIDRPDSNSTVPNAPSCPACGSSAVTTTAKNPNAESYWRCKPCGEVWNVGRRHDRGGGIGAWR